MAASLHDLASRVARPPRERAARCEPRSVLRHHHATL